jgi:uncharacterized membrane protein YkoI
MNLRKAAANLLVLSSAGVLAAAAAASSPPYGLSETVQAMESRYPGKVVAIELDAADDKAAHYHVDMRFPGSGLARLDVDAATLAIVGRQSLPVAAAPTPFVYAVALVSSQIVDGQVIATRLDHANGDPAHYDVDVALPTGSIARLKVDAATGQVAWRTPAIITE